MGLSTLRLSLEDYIVIAASLLISTCIGSVFKFFGGKQESNEEFFLAGRSMSIVPVAFSMVVTFLSPVTLMAMPSELYSYGTPLVVLVFGFMAGIIFAAYIFFPLYHIVQFNTSYQYLEERFGKFSRKLLSFLCILGLVVFTSITLYAPALALSVVTGIPTWLSSVTIGLVCTFYCTMGGMKAILWTDVFQAILMFTCIITVIISGAIHVGGLSQIFIISNEGGRLIFPTFAFDFKTRYTFLSLFIQGFVVTASTFGTSQEQVQRVLVVKNARQAQKAAFLALPLIILFEFSALFCGLVFYAYFKNCDPILEGVIDSPDQLMPYYIMSALGHMKGLPGLCIAGLFSSSLSTVSSQINSLAAITLEDFLVPLFNWPRSASISKALTVFFGLLCLGLTFVVSYMGTILEMTISTMGIFNGLALSYYLLAALCKKANEKGATIGIIFGFVVGAFLTISSANNHYNALPISNECHESIANETKIEISDHLKSSLIEKDNFPVAYMWNAAAVVLISFFVGYIASLIINYFQGEKCFDERFISPVRLWFGRTSKEFENPDSSKQINAKTN